MSEDREQTWKTKDGREIHICDMSSRHINNTLAFLRRKRANYAAVDAYNSGIEIKPSKVKMPKIYDIMVAELELRERYAQLVNIGYTANSYRPLEL